MSRKLALAALALLAALTLYGFYHEHLPEPGMWAQVGRSRFLFYAAAYWVAAAAMLLAAPEWLGASAAAFALIYTAWWTGPMAPLAVLYLFGACVLTGRIFSRRADAGTSTLLGLAAAIFLIGIALHFRVNYRSVYAAVLAIPYLLEARRLPEHLRGFRIRCKSRREAAGLAVLLFVLMAQWLVALNPETSDDGLSMHLAVPLAVLHDARWSFDFHQYTWTLMPNGGECVYTAAALLAGNNGAESAAKLANFALLAIMAALVAWASRRWAGPAESFLVSALFVSTPLAELVTGSLFVENLWAAMILGGSLAILRYTEKGDSEELWVAGALMGSALAAKLVAAVFLAPAAVIAAWAAWRRAQVRTFALAALLLGVAAATPYAYAYIRSGNPVFPFENTIFRSPYFDSQNPFVDVRFLTPLSVLTPYLATFRSSLYIEGQGGSAGFQCFLLLLPAAILAIAGRLKPALLLLGVGAAATLALFAAVPNLRYMYPALPLFSIALAVLFGRLPAAPALFIGITALNVWFMPSSGWYDKEFAMFTRANAAEFRERSVGEELLYAKLNQTNPGEPVAIFDTAMIAGLHAAPYTFSWHTNDYWLQLRQAQSAEEVAKVLRGHGIRQIVAPSSLRGGIPLLDTFLREWAAPEGITAGRMALFRLRDSPVQEPRIIPVFPPGSWDDLDDRIEYTGDWIHDRQYHEALNGSLTYAAGPGDSARLSFTGSAITYIFTKAFNRGSALVLIDGQNRARINEYSRRIEWKTRRSFQGLGQGTHTFEVRVLKQKAPASTGYFVDLDGIEISP